MTIIEAKNIGKKYKITHQKGGYVALRDVLTNIFKNPFSFIKSKAKEVIGLETKEVFWALKGINFEIKKGEIIGIIGRNGAGKSTLLKILSQITPPTTGEIKIKGRVGSLLEVGTGFHPELTGRENIFLNGAILGMTKREIVRKFNDIVKFADIEKFIDTPVKYYSSGMYVRLAFSVAAHMEPDILIVDEVLAVGDAEFQKKCLGKMEEITKKGGRTILFVSHNMSAIKQLCKKTIWISKGEIKMIGETDDVVDLYINAKPETSEENSSLIHQIVDKNDIRFTDIKITNQDGKLHFQSDDKLNIELSYESDLPGSISEARIVFSIRSKLSQKVVLRLDSDIPNKTIPETLPASGKILCQTDKINLTEGVYNLDADFLIGGKSVTHIMGAKKIEIHTSLKDYDFKKYPDNTVCDTTIRYEFR